MEIWEPVKFVLFVHCYVALAYKIMGLTHRVVDEWDLPGRLAVTYTVKIFQLFFAYYLTSKWTAPITQWKFIAFFSAFASSTLSLFAVFDWLVVKPHSFFIPYLPSVDPLIENVWVISTLIFYAFIILPIQWTTLFQMFNGRPWRSLALFSGFTNLYIALVISITAKLMWSHVSNITIIPLVVAPVFNCATLIVLGLSENRSKTSFDPSVNLTQANFVLSLATLAVYFAKLFMGVRGGWEWTKVNDPMLFYTPVKGLPSFGVAIVIIYVILLTGILIKGLQKEKPSYIWELTLVFSSITAVGQFYFIFGPLFHETSPQCRVSPENLIFWVFNLIPLVTALTQLTLYWPKSESQKKSNSSRENGPKKRI